MRPLSSKFEGAVVLTQKIVLPQCEEDVAQFIKSPLRAITHLVDRALLLRRELDKFHQRLIGAGEEPLSDKNYVKALEMDIDLAQYLVRLAGGEPASKSLSVELKGNVQPAKELLVNPEMYEGKK